MEKGTKELFKRGHVYFMLDNDESDEATIFDLTAMDENTAAKILEKALNEA